MSSPSAVAGNGPARALRWLPWVGLLVIVAVALAIGSQRHTTPTLEQRTMSIAGQVRCPLCVGETAAQSNIPASEEIRAFIRQQLVAGETRSEILGQLQADYPLAGILESPPARGVNLVLWFLPGVAVAAALIGLVVLFRRWRPARVTGVSDDDRLLVGGLLATADGEPSVVTAGGAPVVATEPDRPSTSS